MISLFFLVCSSNRAMGIVFTDAFDGTTSYSTNASVAIGEGWVNPYETTSDFRVANKDGELSFDAPSGVDMNYMIYNTGLALAAGTAAGDGTNWTLTVDVRTKITGTYAGVAFNIQDQNNFYALRIKSGSTQAQVVKVVSGSISSVEAGSTSMVSNTVAGQMYTFTISCDQAGTIDYTITEKGSSTVLNQITTSTSAVVFDGGYGGLYLWHGETAGNSPEAVFDNLSIQAVAPIDYAEGSGLSDTFDGTTAYSTNAAEAVGEGWVNPYETTSAFRVAKKDGELSFDAPEYVDMNYMIYNTGLVMTAGDAAGDGTNWTLSADVRTKITGTYAGVAFNIQDENNFYALRIKTGSTQAQLVKVVSGTISNVEAGNASMVSNTVAGQIYTFTISCDQAGTFEYMITEKGSSTVLNQIGFSASTVVFDGGYAGLYLWHGEAAGNSPEAVFDNFSLQVLPAVDTASYSAWIDQYPSLGSETGYTDDPDSDNMNNLLEYALGGNPTLSDASSVLPAGSLVDDGGTLEMVYLRRLDAAAQGLTYDVQANTSLLADESWSAVGITETSGTVDDEFESVTNRISTAAADAQFMQLTVEAE
jgi:DNA-binding XRE family transcriptional regulator